MSESELLYWLGSRTSTRPRSLKDVQGGREICKYLCEIADSNESMKDIQRGATVEERLNNFNLAQSLFSLLKLDFSYDIQKLANCDREELCRFIGDLMGLDEDDQPQDYQEDTPGETEENDDKLSESDNQGLTDLLNDLENDLSNKLQNAEQFHEELRSIGLERDFYLGKLLEIEKSCEDYKPAETDAVLKVLQLQTAEFMISDDGK